MMMTSDLKPYPAYKDSGVEWLGEVPEHWELPRLGALLQERGEVNSNRHVDKVLSVLRDRGVIPYSEKGNIGNKMSEDITRYKVVRPDDIVVNCMNVIIGSVGLSRYTGCLSPVYYVLTRRSDDDDPRYLNACFQTKPFQESLVRIGNGILSHRMRIPMELLKCEPFPKPPTEEQTAIVRFLDHADRRIQRYIRAKQKLIALLEEQKQAIIHSAVTRGLDPNVRLKPSGVEGLGDVPAHWEVVALGYLATKFGSGVTPRGGATVYQEAGIPFLRSQNIHFDGLHLEGVARITPRLHQSLSNTHVKPGDVLLNITGASIGRVCFVPDHFSEGNVSQHVCIIRPKKNRLLSGFLASFLSTAFMQREIRFEQNGASREGLTLHSIRNFKIVLPTISEQQHILAEIRAHTERLAAAVTATRRQIALLQEYHTRLIADVVTGKLDVREAAAELPEVDPLAEDDLDGTIHDGENSNLGELKVAEEVTV